MNYVEESYDSVNKVLTDKTENGIEKETKLGGGGQRDAVNELRAPTKVLRVRDSVTIG